MAKTVFVCSNCGYESTKWLGKCPGCNEWNSFYEEKLSTKDTKTKAVDKKMVAPKPLNDVVGKDSVRTHTGIGELDRVLGGGIVARIINFSRWRAWYWQIYTNFTALRQNARRRKSAVCFRRRVSRAS